MLLHELGIVDEDFLKIIVKGSVLDVRHLVVIGVRQSNRVMRSRLRLDDDLHHTVRLASVGGHGFVNVVERVPE